MSIYKLNMNNHILPTIVLVPGAFGAPSGFDKLARYLHKAGFPTRPGPYPSCDPIDVSVATSAEDIVALRRNVLLPLLNEERKDVVIIAHSYGGVVAGGAAKNLGKTNRRHVGTGIIGLIYIAGNITLDGESLLGAIGGAYPPFIKQDKPRKGLALIEPAMDILYNDVDPVRGPELEKRMKPHALLAFETPATAPAWADRAFDGRRAYIRTSSDCCNPPSVQDSWIKKSKVKWNVVDFDTGHMPFESQPEALSEQVVEFISGFLVLEESTAPKSLMKWDRFYARALFAMGLTFSFCCLYWK